METNCTIANQLKSSSPQSQAPLPPIAVHTHTFPKRTQNFDIISNQLLVGQARLWNVAETGTNISVAIFYFAMASKIAAFSAWGLRSPSAGHKLIVVFLRWHQPTIICAYHILAPPFNEFTSYWVSWCCRRASHYPQMSNIINYPKGELINYLIYARCRYTIRSTFGRWYKKPNFKAACQPALMAPG